MFRPTATVTAAGMVQITALRASLEITVPTGWLMTLLLSFMLFYDMLSFVACIRCLWHQSQLPG
jgi:hypothetical protein